jgi:hypothetical protein
MSSSSRSAANRCGWLRRTETAVPLTSNATGSSECSSVEDESVVSVTSAVCQTWGFGARSTSDPVPQGECVGQFGRETYVSVIAPYSSGRR